MTRIIYENKAKGIQWSVYTFMSLKFKNHYASGTEFYLFPTVNYQRFEEFEFENEHSFAINFVWLFWKLSINRYWGDVFK